MSKGIIALIIVSVVAMAVGGGLMFAQWSQESDGVQPQASVAAADPAPTPQPTAQSASKPGLGEAIGGFVDTMVDYWKDFEPNLPSLSTIVDYDPYEARFETAVRSIQVNAKVRSVKISPYDGDEILVQSLTSEASSLEAKLSDGVLSIEETLDRRWTSWNFGAADATVYVFIPQALAQGQEIAIQVDASVGEVEILDLGAREINIETNTGSIELSNLSVKDSLVAKTNVGSVEAKRCTAQSTQLYSDVGSIDVVLEGDPSGMEMDLDTSLGDVRVDGKGYERRYRQTAQEGSPSLKAKTNVGSITVTR